MKWPVVSFMALLMAIPAVRAQDAPKPQKNDIYAWGPLRNLHGFELTKDQRTKIEALLKEYNKAVEAYRQKNKEEIDAVKKKLREASKSRDQEAKDAAIEAFRKIMAGGPRNDDLRTKAMAVLTDEQKLNARGTFPPAWGDSPRGAKRHVEMKEVGRLDIGKGEVKKLPAGFFVASSKALDELWETAKWDANKKPNIDFKKSFLLIDSRDKADPNRRNYSGTVSGTGVFSSTYMSTAIGYLPSDQRTLTFRVVPREGVTGIARHVPTGDRKRRSKRVIYPLTEKDKLLAN